MPSKSSLIASRLADRRAERLTGAVVAPKG